MEDSWSQRFLRCWQGSHKAAIVTDEQEISGTDLIRRASGASRFMDDIGVQAGDPLPVLIDESDVAIGMAVGGALTGRPLAPLGTKLTVEELSAQIRNLAVPNLVASYRHEKLAREIAETIPLTLTLLDSLEVESADFKPPSPGDTVAIVHTSGTTGLGRPVSLAQASMANRIAVYESVLGLNENDVFCTASPFYHTAGIAMILTVLAAGSAVIPMDCFTSDQWQRAGRLGMTVGLLVPTMIEMLLQENKLGMARPRLIQYGASPIHPDTLKNALAVLHDTEFVQIFGQTEVSPVTYLSHRDHQIGLESDQSILETVGKAVPGCEIRLEKRDSDGVGEVTVRTAHNFSSDPDGWRRTGDLGRFLDNGYLHLCGRTHDKIIRGGENIYPVEIEQAICSHPAVECAAVIGVADRKWGESIKAFVVPVSLDSPPPIVELQDFLRSRLAHFKVPETIEFVPDLPLNQSGKLLRRKLK